MTETRSERIAQWSEHADQLCDDGETVERRVDLERATVVVTNRRVMTFVPDADGPEFRHAERPNVGTVSVETDDRLGQLCWGIVAAFVGVGLLEMARTVRFVDFAPSFGFRDTGSLPGSNAIANLVDAALSATETALLGLDWGVLLSGVAALAIAAAFGWRYVRSRSRRLVLRVRGEDALEVPVSKADLEAGLIADIETAIRPESTPALTLEESTGAEGGRSERRRDERTDDEQRRGERTEDERLRDGHTDHDDQSRTDRPGAEWLGDEESG
ncbi:hypothetical protein HYG81_09730 [Natrinema zhouii]|uniref:Uncharacterized protein n=1 Tax=Natrinema zhouii TaxID=1710539 RepID=A0A7D6GSQ4_9EURY|nr:hypothetical protein [Natrinema zhouii]QLK24404.1 hypothetical protein HYG81_09730 [Natrinema zhouii]